MVQIFNSEVESHLINPGNAERSLLILNSLFFGHIKDRNIVMLQNKSCTR